MRKQLLYVVVLVFLLTFTASATTLTFVGYPAGLKDPTFYVGEAMGVLDDSEVWVWCVDSLHRISVGDSWNVDVISLSNPTGLAGLLGLTVNDYKAMFLLTQQFTNTNPTDTSLQHSIWWFTNPSDYPLSAAQLAQKNSALAAVGSYNWTNAYVLVPQGLQSDWGGQIFETGRVNPVPEPMSFVLIGTGLICLGLIRRQQRKTM